MWIDFIKNTEKSPGDFRRLAIASVKDHQLKLMWKTLIIRQNLIINERVASIVYVVIEMKQLNKCSKLALKEYKNRYDCMGKVIYWELYKKLNFRYTGKRYMHRLDAVLENELHKILWDKQIIQPKPEDQIWF